MTSTMGDDENQDEPESVQPPTEGGSGTAETGEGAEAAEERQDDAEEGSGQQGRGRVQ